MDSFFLDILFKVTPKKTCINKPLRINSLRGKFSLGDGKVRFSIAIQRKNGILCVSQVTTLSGLLT
jgi:hypothetical protein